MTDARVTIANSVPVTNTDTAAARRELLAYELALETVALNAVKADPSLRDVEVDVDREIRGWSIPFVRAMVPPDRVVATGVLLDASAMGVLENGIPPEHFGESVRKFRYRLTERLARQSQISSPQIAEAIAFATARGNVFTSPEYIETMIAQLESITPDECLSVLRANWPMERMTLIISSSIPRLEVYNGPLPEALRQSREAKSWNRAPSAGGSTDAPASEGATFNPPRFELGEISAVANRVRNDVLGATIIDFANGVRLNLKNGFGPADRS